MSSGRFITRFIYSFPIQLLMVLIKKNHILLLYWLILFGFVTGTLSQRFGIPYLFLDPEYLGHVGFSSFCIMGFAVGCFVMVYNISSYIVNGFRFPFIATLARPFIKFTLNNFIIPLLFMVVYLWRLIDFQLYYELRDIGSVLFDAAGFLAAFFVVTLFTLTYFFQTNKDIVRMFGVEASDSNPDAPYASHIIEEKDGKKFLVRFRIRGSGRKNWRVDTYLTSPFRVKLIRKSDHYAQEMIDKVFRQNHLNAAIVEIIVFSMCIVMGLFKEKAIFQIPAGASILLIFSMLLMLSGAFRFWLKAWAATVFYAVLFMLNFLSQYGVFHAHNKAYGLSYDSSASYTLSSLASLGSEAQVNRDMDSTLAILNNWKSKFSGKPKLVLVNVSGGGLRSTLWTFRVMQVADSLTTNNFIRSSELITGASGGIVGAACYRELFKRRSPGSNDSFRSDVHLLNAGKDLLNPVAFSITVSDLFFSFRKFTDGNTEYRKDRAYVFERQLNHNMDGILDTRIGDYRSPEQTASIPMMIFSPTIVNDGRRMLISPQDISYLTTDIEDTSFHYESTRDGVEFRRLFRNQRADSLRYTTVLRMSATFPYILPAVNMPSTPSLQIMDAGLRDNTGLKISIRFLYTFRKWIEENTSGVVFVDIRDSHRMRPLEEKPNKTYFEDFTAPLGNVYGNLLRIQDYNVAESFIYAKSCFPGMLDYVTFELPTKEEDISLSWHLTTREKNSIINAADLPQNAAAFRRLSELLKVNRPIQNR